MISLTELGSKLESLGSETEQQIYYTRIGLLRPALIESFDSPKEQAIILTIIDTLNSISAAQQVAPMYKYLIRAIELCEESNAPQINFLNQVQTDFIINNLEKFREVLRYLVIGNRRIELSIPQELHNSVEKSCLSLYQQSYESLLS